MKLIGEEGLDLAVIPIGDNFTMGPDDALRAVKFLEPKAVIPIHYNTFDLIAQDENAWAERVREGDEYKGCSVEARRKLFFVRMSVKTKDRDNCLGLFYLLKYRFASIPRKNTKSTATITPAAHPNSGAKRSNSTPASFKTLDTPQIAVAENPSVFKLRVKVIFLGKMDNHQYFQPR